MERTNARDADRVDAPRADRPRVIDVSFISLDARPRAGRATWPGAATIVALVKPQFEAGKGRTDHGVVRDPAVHREVLERVVAAARALGLGTRARHRVADPGAGGQPRVPPPPAPGPGCADIGDRIAAADGAP